ncbi:unnamed protein product [Chrysodeixis includens]|uniref:Uncharacterized protein n=1 Tax=Chrysodeixis includens TaxID=689277 RepID=A0A9N8KXD9_CHRIL|nr:unnamed protein product [Chrysodeixis includens]
MCVSPRKESAARTSCSCMCVGGCASVQRVPPSEACGRMPEAAFLSPPPAGEMSPNSIPKYLKRPLWRERKCVGRGARGRATVGQRRARQSHAPPRARAPPAPPRARAPPPAFQRARLPPNLLSRDLTPAPTHATPGL